MATAIVYRANESLDANLLGLKDKADFFIRFEPQELSDDDYEMKRGIIIRLREVIGRDTLKKGEIDFFVDLTCAPGIQQAVMTDKRVSIISQDDGQLEAWVSVVAKEGKSVVVVRENLADHVEVDGVDPYKLDQRDREPGGWYHTKVLSIWESGLREKGAAYRIVSAREILGMVLEGLVVVCDHHCTNRNPEIRQNAGWRNAYRANPCKLVKMEDIPIL